MSAPPSPSGDVIGPTRALPWGLIGLTAVMLTARLIVAGSLHLTEDEAYYRLLAQAPAMGYFDHPPMVAWWIWLGVRLAGDTPLGVRLAPILASALTSVLVYDCARIAGASAVESERAGVWYNATLLVAAGGFLAVPDAPATLFWVLDLWLVLRALRSGAAGWWLAAGLSAGLACLSKYSALFLGPGILTWLLWTPNGRAALRTPGPWLALLLAAAIFGLNLAWNQAHDWQTIIKQFGRIAPRRIAPRFALEFLGAELLLFNPLMALFLARPGPSRSAQGASRRQPFLVTSLPFIGYLLLHSLHDRIEAHWPAPVYPAMAVCAALGATAASGVWAWLRSATPWVGLGAVAAAALAITLPAMGVPLRPDPAQAIRGWPQFAATIEGLRRDHGAAWVGTTSYGLAAELLDEPGMTAPVVQISERVRWRALVQGREAPVERPGVIIDLSRRIDPALLGRCFTTVRALGAVYRGPAREMKRAYTAFLVAGPRRDILGKGCEGDAPEAS